MVPKYPKSCAILPLLSPHPAGSSVGPIVPHGPASVNAPAAVGQKRPSVAFSHLAPLIPVCPHPNPENYPHCPPSYPPSEEFPSFWMWIRPWKRPRPPRRRPWSALTLPTAFTPPSHTTRFSPPTLNPRTLFRRRRQPCNGPAAAALRPALCKITPFAHGTRVWHPFVCKTTPFCPRAAAAPLTASALWGRSPRFLGKVGFCAGDLPHGNAITVPLAHDSPGKVLPLFSNLPQNQPAPSPKMVSTFPGTLA